MTNWISVVENLPVAGKKVLATFENSHGKRRTICGNYVPRWTIESDCDDAYDEYNEEKDAYYLREGWYENIENWGDFSSVYVCEGEVTHWMPLPDVEGLASSDDVSPREITDSIQAIKAGDSQSVLALVSALWRALNFIRGHGDFEHREALERCECYACVTGEIIDSLAAHRKGGCK